jgi:hypothetical protein
MKRATVNRPEALLPALLAAALIVAAVPVFAQSGSDAPSPAKVCADRWNEMKAKNQTGDLTYRDFAQKCLADTAKAAAKDADPGNAPAAKPQAARPAETPPPKRGTAPTGPSAAAAQPSMKQCADLWNELKAKNETGNQTYRDFAKQCLAGTTALPKDDDGQPDEKAAAPAKPRTSVPSVAARPTPDPAPALSKAPDENDREAVNRCNAEWGDYKARHNLTGAKAWHVFMARCLP